MKKRRATKKLALYLLSFSWGLPMTIVGLAAALVLRMQGRRAKRFGLCLHFEAGENWGGISLGLVLITQSGASERLLAHEHGHFYQNCLFGPLMPFVVGLPSLIRANFRKAWAKRGKLPRGPYDAIWFERQATEWGERFC